MARYVTTARIVDGILAIRNRRQFNDQVKAFANGEYLVTIEKAHAVRSKPQNDYYWAVVVPRIASKFQALGLMAGDDPQTTHEVLKSQFIDPELVRTGQIRGFLSDTGLTLGTSTTDLNKLQFIDYLDRIIDHAALHWDTYIPPPDPLWREHAESEAA